MRTNATIQQVEEALSITNEKYGNNVIFNRFEKIGNWVHFTLRVKDSSGMGARVSVTGRKSTSACWHVHGYVFAAIFELNAKAVIHTSSSAIRMTKQYGNWLDWLDGGKLASELCECKKHFDRVPQPEKRRILNGAYRPAIFKKVI